MVRIDYIPVPKAAQIAVMLGVTPTDVRVTTDTETGILSIEIAKKVSMTAREQSDLLALVQKWNPNLTTKV